MLSIYSEYLSCLEIFAAILQQEPVHVLHFPLHPPSGAVLIQAFSPVFVSCAVEQTLSPLDLCRGRMFFGLSEDGLTAGRQLDVVPVSHVLHVATQFWRSRCSTLVH